MPFASGLPRRFWLPPPGRYSRVFLFNAKQSGPHAQSAKVFNFAQTSGDQRAYPTGQTASWHAVLSANGE
jgi:hypothetical protein